jgi:hypothetical protein
VLILLAGVLPDAKVSLAVMGICLNISTWWAAAAVGPGQGRDRGGAEPGAQPRAAAGWPPGSAARRLALALGAVQRGALQLPASRKLGRQPP